MLRNVQNSFGMNLLGNLLDLGQVAFVPETAAEMPAVLSLADHMLKQHSEAPTFVDEHYSISARSVLCHPL